MLREKDPRSKDTAIWESFCHNRAASNIHILVVMSCLQLGLEQQVRWAMFSLEVQVGHTVDVHIPHWFIFLATGSHPVTHLVIQICQERGMVVSVVATDLPINVVKGLSSCIQYA